MWARHLSPHDGLSLFRAIQANGGQVYGSDNLSSLEEPISAMIDGVSDASVKSPSAAHAWILSSGAKTDLDNPLLHIAGTGPVDGYVPYLSSTRGELQGQTALTIITNLFLQHHNFQATLVMICDSKSAQSIQVRPATRLRQHRDPDLDLRLQIQHEASSLSIRREWVKGHQDSYPWDTADDLRAMKLPTDATYNIWCDRIAGETCSSTYSDPTPSVLPAEKWAVYTDYPVPHKVTSQFDKDIYTSLSFPSMSSYLGSKHNLSPTHLHEINSRDLQHFLGNQTVHYRATFVKLIHGWIPTYEFLHRQGRHDSPICPRCSSYPETHSHVYQCLATGAVKFRTIALNTFLDALLARHTPMAILISFELKLSGALALPYAQRFSLASPISLHHHRAIITAVRHQNILGWDMFLKGFISTKWEDAYHLLKDRSAPTFPISWPRFLTTTVLHTLHSIWCNCNKIIHGTSQKEKLHLERL